ncbi:ABC transporter permease [Pyrococcus furiosus DSM 3638]|uniref:Oligopeptide transport system permease protein n=3 Tax=Pyrococcus furiosus TaxID=2261 RepID=Q8U498_PYRFU|nr:MULTISPECIES: ABC transporter permease [Pyrococcus]AAL80315.1 oligopeptide transport system permease protein [Pyrococcus furiosus DSM 3638]AFN02978.1 oligopeptide transport system permease [Pyrococcus furiosus COM1]MDK2869923.1 peptide/nickel transport system permease protein [Pyrococcus sp.]QEK77917.1 ABC transporter permease [Pyrococcus furiosus DSM 3638]
MGLGKYLLIRAINALIVLSIVVLVVSALFVKVAEKELESRIQEIVNAEYQSLVQQNRAPSDPEAWKMERIKYYRHLYKLDQPYHIRVLYYAKRTITLDFGNTRIPIFGTERNVKAIISLALPRTILLFTTAQIIVIILGLLLGVKAAQKVGSLFDRALSVLALVTTSIPMWWFGMIMLLIFAFKLGWFPSNSMPNPNLTGLDHVLDVARRLVLPITTIVFVLFGGWAWVTRNIMISTLQEDFIMVARAKGVPERKVIYGHGLRAAAPPIVTMTIFSLLGSLGGAIITESVFNWPGMGRVYWIAIETQEINLVMGLTFISVVLYLAGVIIADISYGFLDPRVRVGASAKM